MTLSNGCKRIDTSGECNAADGEVTLSYSKLFWLGGMIFVSIVGGFFTFSVSSVAVFLVSTAVSLCFGHSLGMHRLLIHNSFRCPAWLEYLLVHLGVIVGLAGPIGMMKTHDLRDWAQRQPRCHDFFGHGKSMIVDAYWQLFCDIQLRCPPGFKLEDRVKNNFIYRLMERTWMLQQLPWVVLFYLLGGIAWVVWGVCMRVCVSVLGHWLIGYFAHNKGQQSFYVKGAAVQGYNVKFAALLTMGESWHNNHHAFPGSAKIGLFPGEIDLGWKMLLIFQRLGLVWNIVEPKDLPPRPELRSCVKKDYQQPARC